MVTGESGKPVVLAAGPDDRIVNLVRAAGVASVAEGTTLTRLFVSGTKIEIIETHAVTSEQVAEVEPDKARVFILGHRWALATATRCTVTVAGTDAREDLPVATPAALVAMKLHAIQDRSSDEKRASDAWDLYRLLNSYNRDGTLSNAFADGPPGLTALVAGALTRVFRTEVTRTRHWIVGYGEPGWSQVLSTQVLADITDEFVTGLELRSPLGE